jgi:hypothetical protein
MIHLRIVTSIPLERKTEIKYMLSTTFRRALVASGLVIATSGFMASAAFAVDPTDNVVLQGTVTSTLAMSATEVAGASTINLAPAQSNIELKVADIAMGTNNSSGLSLKIDTGSSFSLATTQGATSVPFTVGSILGDGSSVKPLAYKSTVNDVLLNTGSATAPNTAYSLFITYTTDPAFQDPGVYNATIKLVASDN